MSGNREEETNQNRAGKRASGWYSRESKKPTAGQGQEQEPLTGIEGKKPIAEQGQEQEPLAGIVGKGQGQEDEPLAGVSQEKEGTYLLSDSYPAFFFPNRDDF